MRPLPGTAALLLLLFALGAFVWLTAEALPPVVASHFSASGAADGFMPRKTYRANELRPPALSTTGIIAGLVVFFLALAVWLFVLYARFRQRA